MIAHFKGKVQYYLTFNEINCGTLPLGNYMSLGIRNEGTRDFLHQVDDVQVRYQALHHQLRPAPAPYWPGMSWIQRRRSAT